MPRLDLEMVARKLVPTRSRALDLIRRGFVSVGGVVVTKAGMDVVADATIALSVATPGYVSRGAEKLIGGLEHFRFDVSGRYALDIGASTGGFTEVLLQRGAAHVTAVDVGREQLHPKLAADPRVTVRERTDARQLVATDFAAPIDAVTADVSFIALEKALPIALGLAAPGAWLIALVKPQFEVGRQHIGKRGIVRDAAASSAAIARITAWLETSGWSVAGTIASPITGTDGNQEYLVGAEKQATSSAA